jgi:hypothetical protein
LEPPLFREVMMANIGFIVDEIIADTLLLAIPQQLLSNEQLSTYFAHYLLTFVALCYFANV